MKPFENHAAVKSKHPAVHIIFSNYLLARIISGYIHHFQCFYRAAGCAISSTFQAFNLSVFMYLSHNYLLQCFSAHTPAQHTLYKQTSMYVY